LLACPQEECDELESGLETPVCASAPDAETLVETLDLSPARRRVVACALQGLSEKDIARQVRLSPHTVHNHIQAIYQLLGVHSRSELLARLLKAGRAEVK
jgi:DNA-binding NarL/FixJ family response regulator